MKILRTGFVMLLISSLITSCEKDENALTAEEESAVDYFIPRDNNVYHYEITTADGKKGTRDLFVTGHRDSAGIDITNVRGDITFDNEVLTGYNDMFTMKGKTIVKVDRAEYVMKYIAKMREAVEQAGGRVIKSELSGYPYFMHFDNLLREGGKLDFMGPDVHRLELVTIMGSGGQQTQVETIQDITFVGGEVTKVEQVTVPAGTFTCNKFFYTMNTHIVTKMNGNVINTLDNTEQIEVWMAHGVGDVKVVEKLKEGTATTVLKSIQKQ
jgi:hypothetical protein